jgi:hypothetical protein
MKRRWQLWLQQSHHRLPIALGSLVVALLVGSVALAQSDGLRMSMWTLGSGGGQSAGGEFSLVGTAGQVAASSTAVTGQGGDQTFRVKGGFWPAMPSSSTPISLYLPAVSHFPTIAPVRLSTWQALEGQGITMSSLTIHNEQLFAGARITRGGLYRKQLSACDPKAAVERFNTVDAATVYSVKFAGQLGIAATHERGLFISRDSGTTWTRLNPNVERPRAITLAPGGIFHVGTQDKGLYTSSDGVTWTPSSSTPADINTLGANSSSVWIGAFQTGVWLFTLPTPVQRRDGLEGKSLNIQDFAFSGTTIYVATDNGVFRGDGASRWENFGLSGVEVFSVEITNDQLYAGTNGQGVFKRPLTGGDWAAVTSTGWDATVAVRDLLYDPTYCRGLLAATSNGLWVYR